MSLGLIQTHEYSAVPKPNRIPPTGNFPVEVESIKAFYEPAACVSGMASATTFTIISISGSTRPLPFSFSTR